MLRKIARLIPAQLCFILHHLSWWKLLFAVGNFHIILRPWYTDALYTHPSLLCWLRLSVMCLFLFVVQEMEERIQHFDTFLWDGENTHQVDPEQPGTTKDTHKLSEREWRSFWVQPSTQKKKQKTTTENPVPLLFLRGNTTRTRLRTETFNGAIVSGTWPDPDPFYTTKLLEVCQSHTHTHTHRRWRATLVLLGCYPNFYPCCSWDYFLTWND